MEAYEQGKCEQVSLALRVHELFYTKGCWQQLGGEIRMDRLITPVKAERCDSCFPLVFTVHSCVD